MNPVNLTVVLKRVICCKKKKNKHPLQDCQEQELVQRWVILQTPNKKQ